MGNEEKLINDLVEFTKEVGYYEALDCCPLGVTLDEYLYNEIKETLHDEDKRHDLRIFVYDIVMEQEEEMTNYELSQVAKDLYSRIYDFNEKEENEINE